MPWKQALDVVQISEFLPSPLLGYFPSFRVFPPGAMGTCGARVVGQHQESQACKPWGDCSEKVDLPDEEVTLRGLEP